MSASPNNTGLQLIKELITEEPIAEELINEKLITEKPISEELINEGAASVPASAPHATSTVGLGHEALQALLAFSSLHQQIRQRRLREQRSGRSLTREDDWQLEQFVLDEVLQLVAERALTITGADGIALALAENNAIICRASAGSIAPDAGMRLDPNAGFSGECLVSGRIVRCDDVDTDARVNLAACRRLGVRSMVAVPLSARQSIIGLIEAFSTEPYGFNDSDVRSLNLLAELILSAMRPEEEDRLAEISRRVVLSPAALEPVPAVQPEMARVEPALKPSASAPEISEAGSEQISKAISISQPVSISRSISSHRSDETSEPVANPVTGYKSLDRSTPGLAVVAAVVVLAAALGAGVWWALGHRARAVSATTHAPVTSQPAPHATPDSAAPTQPPPPTALADDDLDSAPATPEPAGVLPQVTGIRHWSSADSSTVVIDIQDQVQYEAHRLPKPERIYFDLHDTKLAAELSNQIISVDDALLQRVRVAQPMAGVTRVVLETKGPSDFSVSLEPHPYRLVVEVRRLGSKPHARAKIDLFAPANPAASGQIAANQIPPTPAPLSGNHDRQLPASPLSTGAGRTPVSAPKLCVVLDAGHGGWDLGTVGRKGLLEKDLVLDIVERAGHLIETRLGANVIYTRKDDTYLPLEKRAEIANLAQAKLFVSVHANYSDYASARGVETYYSNTYSSVKARTEEADEAAATSLQNIDWTNVDIREKVHESRRIAASVQHALYAVLAAKNPGLPNRGVKEAHYVVLTGTSMPAILAEVSFVSSPTDENNLQSSTYRQQIAEALYTGIARYEAANHPVKIASAKPAGR
jgi:N-acetylmuramoyl-L-alanine amidase